MRTKISIGALVLAAGTLGFAVGIRAHAEWPQGAIAKIDDQVITLEGFKDWLTSTHGWSYLDDYLELEMLRKEAKRLGLEVGEKDIDLAFEELWHNQVVTRFGSDEDVFLQELAKAKIDKEGERRRRHAQVERDLLGKLILQKTRVATESILRSLHEDEFGSKGIRTHLKVAFFNSYRGFDPNVSDRAGSLAKLRDAAQKRADQFAKTVRDDVTKFESLVPDSDPALVPRPDGWMADLRERGGDLPRYNEKLFNGALEKHLTEGLESGSVLGPIEANQGFYVLHFLKREEAPYDEIRLELEELLRMRIPSPKDLFALRSQLREKARIEIAPTFP